MLNELVALGLTKGEAKVYVALTKIGSATVGPITKEANVSPSNTYDILERLQKKGLITFIIKQKTRYYQATPKENLGLFLKRENDEKKELLDQLLPSLQERASKQEAELFIGTKALRTAYQIMLQTTNKLDFFLSTANIEAMGTFYARNGDIFRNKKIRGIAHEKYRNHPRQEETSGWVNWRYVNFPVPATADITEDKVLITSWDSLIGVLITSKEIAQSFQEHFDAVWKMGRR